MDEVCVDYALRLVFSLLLCDVHMLDRGSWLRLLSLLRRLDSWQGLSYPFGSLSPTKGLVVGHTIFQNFDIRCCSIGRVGVRSHLNIENVGRTVIIIAGHVILGCQVGVRRLIGKPYALRIGWVLLKHVCLIQRLL